MLKQYLNGWGLNEALNLMSHQFIRYAIGVLLILALFWLIKQLVKKYLFPWVERLLAQTENELEDKLARSFFRPIEWLITLSAIYTVLRYLPLRPGLDQLIVDIYRSAIIALIAWGLYVLAAGESVLYREFKEKFSIDDILIAFLSKVLRFIIIALALVVIIQEWGYEVNGFIAGLGLGGLAFALAAQDALSNVFGGIVIIIEKPFSIGDWIVTPAAEGIVEDINFRSTRLRAFDQSLITIPNSTLAKEAITNYSRMGKRRISFHLGVTYDTPRLKLEQCVAGIREMLNNHPDVHPETVFVYFEKFNDDKLDIFLYFFTNTTVWGEYLAVRQDINLKIMEILEDLEVLVALPIRNIYLKNIDKLAAAKEDSPEDAGPARTGL